MCPAYYVGAYWGSRQESIEDCAQRLCSFLRCAAGCSSYFSRWFLRGQSIRDALKHEVLADVAFIRNLLTSGKHFNENLGFHVGLWNGVADEAGTVGLSVTCGSSSPWVNNACVINLPTLSESSTHILQISTLKALVICVAIAFDPDWCILTSDVHLDILATKDSDEPFAGWLLYLPSRHGMIPKPDMPATAELIDGLGTLLVATTEPFDIANPVHMAAASAINAALKMQGLRS